MSHYSDDLPEILDKRARFKIARQIYGVLRVHLGKTEHLNCLDTGASSGVISYYLARHFRNVVGTDIDASAIKIAKKNYKGKNIKFSVMDSENMEFEDDTFDVVICNQVYNFVGNPDKLLDEIHRVLKPHGVCFFAARNKYALMEPQYNLPFLSWVSPKLAELCIRLAGKGDNYHGENYMSYFHIKRLVHKFTIHDYTLRIVRNPKKYGFDKFKKISKIARIIPIELVLPLIPNYIWVLEKNS